MKGEPVPFFTLEGGVFCEFPFLRQQHGSGGVPANGERAMGKRGKRDKKKSRIQKETGRKKDTAKIKKQILLFPEKLFPPESGENSACVVLDDAHDFDLHRNFFEHRFTHDGHLELILVSFKIRRDRGIDPFGDFSDGGGFFRVDRDDLAGFDLVGSAVDDFPVDENMSVVDELLCRKNGGRHAGMVDDRSQTQFNSAEQLFIGSAFSAFCREISRTELAFRECVMSFELLLFLHHFAIGGKFLPLGIFSLKSCGIGSFHARALRHVPDAVAEPSAEFVFCLSFFHPVLPFFSRSVDSFARRRQAPVTGGLSAVQDADKPLK